MADNESHGLPRHGVIERREEIAIRRETVAAFVGPAPRGPVDLPVAIRSVREFARRFGSPEKSSRLENVLEQYFANGGRLAIVVRVGSDAGRTLIELAAGSGKLALEAINPGHFEYLRASVDYDNVTDAERFNLVVQRLDSPRRRIVAEQEIWRNLSLYPEDADYIGDILEASRLARVDGSLPRERPDRTFSDVRDIELSYVYARARRAPARPISDYDLIGSDVDSTGLHALDLVPHIDIVQLISGDPADDLGPVALLAAERYCRHRHAILIVDPPRTWHSAEDAGYAQRATGLNSPHVVTYFPRLLPSSRDQGRPAVGLGGAIAGCLASDGSIFATAREPSDHARTLRSPRRLTHDLDDAEQRALLRSGINPLRPGPRGTFMMGRLVTTGTAPGLPPGANDLQAQRVALFVLGTLSGVSHRVVRDSSGARNGGRNLEQQIRGLLTRLADEGLLFGQPANGAYFVTVEEIAGESQDSVDRANIVVGLALRRPGEFSIYRITQERTRCRIHALGMNPDLAVAV